MELIVFFDMVVEFGKQRVNRGRAGTLSAGDCHTFQNQSELQMKETCAALHINRGVEHVLQPHKVTRIRNAIN
jgi:hypothetical protein